MEPALLLHTQWALAGDHSRYRFAAALAERPAGSWDAKEAVWLAGEASAPEDTSAVFVQSRNVPPGIRLCLLPDSTAVWNVQLAGFRCCIVFEEFPWQKESTEMLLRAWWSMPSRPALTLVLMRQEHRAGSTDLDSIDATLEEARRAYAAQGIPVLVEGSGQLLDVFSMRDSVIQKYREDLRGQLVTLRDRIEDFSDYYCKEEFPVHRTAARGCLGMGAKDEIISYAVARASGETCLWAAWNKAALGLLFAAGRPGNMCEVLRAYEDILRATQLPAFAEMDVPAACIQLEAALKAAFLSHMVVPPAYDRRISWDEVRSAGAYAGLLRNRKGEHIAYWKKYKEFLAEVVESVCMERLDGYYRHWEGMIS